MSDPLIDPVDPPQADTTLAALAVIEQFSQGEYQTLDALLDATDEHELVIGLLDVSRHLATMLANAAGTTEQDVVDHLRSTVLGLISSGALSSGPPKLS